MLVGTLDVKESEELAAGARTPPACPCVVLNAKNDAEEAAIIAEAGAYGAVTVSTQMAGRGVDIRLGGSDQADRDRVAELGGLYVIGSGRHDSRRVDDQLRGRAGRQGDPGGSVFFVSLEDDLVVRNAADALPAVADDQARRPGRRTSRSTGRSATRSGSPRASTTRSTATPGATACVIEQQRKALAERRERVLKHRRGRRRCCATGSRRRPRSSTRTPLSRIGRSIALYHIDRLWAEHLALLSEVREGVHLRALARVDPLDEFHRAAVPAFNDADPGDRDAHDRDLRASPSSARTGRRRSTSWSGPAPPGRTWCTTTRSARRWTGW